VPRSASSNDQRSTRACEALGELSRALSEPARKLRVYKHLLVRSTVAVDKGAVGCIEEAVTGAGFERPTTMAGVEITSALDRGRDGHDAHARFRRAIERRALWMAEDAAREMGKLSLEDALRLVHLYAERGSPKFERLRSSGCSGISLKARRSCPTSRRSWQDSWSIGKRRTCRRVGGDQELLGVLFDPARVDPPCHHRMTSGPQRIRN
jgi:hypothetical protein